MRNLIKKILKEEQEWFDEIKPMEVYVPWVRDAIKGFEKWKGDAYQVDDEIGLEIEELKTNPSKKNIERAIKTIERWEGQAYVEGDDFDWALDDLKMSINPHSWKRFNVFDPKMWPSHHQVNESLKDIYITDESYPYLVTDDEEWILIKQTSLAFMKKLPPTLLRTDNLDINSLSRCNMLNNRDLQRLWRHFRESEVVNLKDELNGRHTTVTNNFKLKVVHFKNGMALEKPYDTDSFFQ